MSWEVSWKLFKVVSPLLVFRDVPEYNDFAEVRKEEILNGYGIKGWRLLTTLTTITNTPSQVAILIVTERFYLASG